MHYANGRAARVGDLVRGRGYNVKHEIVGLLLSAQPANSACNCTVAYVGVGSAVVSKGWRTTSAIGLKGIPVQGDISFPHKILEDGSKEIIPSYVEASTEYGQLDAFVALDPNTGEVLPPEAEQAQQPVASI